MPAAYVRLIDADGEMKPIVAYYFTLLRLQFSCFWKWEANFTPVS